MSSAIPAELKHNVKMLSDIVRNLGAGKSQESAVAAVSTHLKKFWSPSMIESLQKHRAEIADELPAVALQALDKLE